MKKNRVGIALLLLASVAGTGQGPMARAPAIVLLTPDYGDAKFENFSAVTVPADDVRLEVVLQEARSDIDLATVRLALNGESVLGFVSLNPLPKGLRVILDLSRVTHPIFRLQPERDNALSFEALDAQRNRYVGEFWVRVDRALAQPQLRAQRREATRVEVEAPPAFTAPRIRRIAPDQSTITAQVISFEAEISDDYGLREVVLEVNGKEVETIVFEFGTPVRKRGGFRTARRLPGAVTGDGHRVSISVPVEVKKPINVLAVRAENIKGMFSSDSYTVVRQK
ncbi:MAG TPA: hypothetical protein VNJ11_01670 [Bryobacteraceae bacterium]|nr:hypothetical protein [Bryobacteraceae bacterium]